MISISQDFCEIKRYLLELCLTHCNHVCLILFSTCSSSFVKQLAEKTKLINRALAKQLLGSCICKRFHLHLQNFHSSIFCLFLSCNEEHASQGGSKSFEIIHSCFCFVFVFVFLPSLVSFSSQKFYCLVSLVSVCFGYE